MNILLSLLSVLMFVLPGDIVIDYYAAYWMSTYDYSLGAGSLVGFD